MEVNLKAEILKILGDQTRLRVMYLLTASKRSLCVCEIVDALKLPQYQVSKSLVLLRRAGLVDVDRNGTWGYYHPKLDDKDNEKLFDFIRSFCSGEPFDADLENLEKRLALREGGKCVVGFVSENELIKLMRKKGVSV
jgi:ArsR family transcriptional regulator